MDLRLDSRTVRSAVAGLAAILLLGGIEFSQEDQAVISDFLVHGVSAAALVSTWIFRVNRRAP